MGRSGNVSMGQLAREYSALSLEAGFEREELLEIKETRWRDELNDALTARGRSFEEIASNDTPVNWRIEVAAALRVRTYAPYRWIADALNIEPAASLRRQVHRHRLQVSA